MKKLKLLLLCLPFSLLANSQAGQINQINIVSFTVKNTLPGNIDSWLSTPGALMLVAQKVPNTRMVEPRLVLQIRSGGAVICGNNNSTAKQVDPFDVRTFNAADLTGLLGNCHELKEGSYTICAQFFNIDKIAISREVCKEFRVEATNIEYAPPTLITPDNGKKFTQQELQGPVMFRWTPLVPKPKEPVTYRLKVWQLMQGQTGATAMRTNQPIVTKDVDNLTQATVSGIYTGPCRPPYLCDFIWSVQALNRNGKPMGNNNGMSEPYTFGVAEEKTNCPANIFPEDKKKLNLREAKEAITFKWKPPVPRESPTYRLRVWQLMQGQNKMSAMKDNKPLLEKEFQDILIDMKDQTMKVDVNLVTGPCKPPYLCDFIWTVEVMGAAGLTGCTSEPTTFSITEEAGKCPANVFPENKKVLTLAEAKKEITFRWTPNGPPGSGHYRLNVWQLKQGQTGAEAMKSNQPLYRKLDVDANGQYDALTDGLMIIRNFITGPCKPPYLCDFIWNVEAIDKGGNTTCTSKSTTFSIAGNDIDIQIDSVYVSCCGSNGLQNVYIKIKNNLGNTVKITNLNIDKVNGVTNVISITGLTPLPPVNIPGLGSQVFTGTIKCIDTAKTIRFFVRAEDAADNAITETEVETDTLNCPCNPCIWMPSIVEKDSLSIPKNGNPTQVNLVGTFTGLNNNIIKKVTAEIIYFNIQQTKDTNCAKCVFDSKYYGNFYPPGSALTGYTGPVFNKPDYSRLVTWNSTIIKDCGGQPHGGGGVDNGDPTKNIVPGMERQTPKNDFGDRMANVVGGGNPLPPAGLPNFNLPIAVPEMNSLSCCGDVIKICIRYTFYDFCCHACEVIRCYTIKREK